MSARMNVLLLIGSLNNNFILKKKDKFWIFLSFFLSFYKFTQRDPPFVFLRYATRCRQANVSSVIYTPHISTRVLIWWTHVGQLRINFLEDCINYKWISPPSHSASLFDTECASSSFWAYSETFFYWDCFLNW